MLRPLLAVLAAALLALVALTAGPATARAPERPVRAVLVDCQRSVDPLERAMVVEGRMRARRRGEGLAIRFDLLQAPRGSRRFRRLQATGLGEWNVADPGVTRYRFRKRIDNLDAPADYRALVRFRWSDAEGNVVARATRRTPVCRQPDLRPDLRVLRGEVGPGPTPRTRTYVALVTNSGRTRADAFDVRATLSDGREASTTVPGLDPGERRRIGVVAPACTAGTPVSLAADVLGAIAESDENDNSLSVTCPG